MALAAPVILWGADAPSDTPRKCARCTACGNEGVTLQRPSWGGNSIGFMPFPATLATDNLPDVSPFLLRESLPMVSKHGGQTSGVAVGGKRR